jgi:hypothetical protein
MKGEAKLQRQSVVIWGVFACILSNKISAASTSSGDGGQSKMTPYLGMLLKPVARKFIT